MKFTLILDEGREEEVVVVAHGKSELTDALEALVLREIPSEKLAAVGADGELLLLSYDEVECISVREQKTYAHTVSGHAFRLRARLYELAARLPEEFIRINKSALANERHIRSFHPTFAGAVDVIFESGFSEYVSRRCFTQIKRRYLK